MDYPDCLEGWPVRNVGESWGGRAPGIPSSRQPTDDNKCYDPPVIETELDVLRDVSQRLEGAGISFMLTGSVAMNYYAQPRMTRDIDLVVSLSKPQTEQFFRLFERDYYFDRQRVAQAILQRRMFNLIHNDAVIKVDCVVLKTDSYRQEEFARRRKINLGDFETWIVSREDLILSKLFWAKDSKSEMQLGDVRNLLSTDCDMEYVRSKAKTLKVDQLLAELLVDE